MIPLGTRSTGYGQWNKGKEGKGHGKGYSTAEEKHTKERQASEENKYTAAKDGASSYKDTKEKQSKQEQASSEHELQSATATSSNKFSRTRQQSGGRTADHLLTTSAVTETKHMYRHNGGCFHHQQRAQQRQSMEQQGQAVSGLLIAITADTSTYPATG